MFSYVPVRARLRREVNEKEKANNQLGNEGFFSFQSFDFFWRFPPWRIFFSSTSFILLLLVACHVSLILGSDLKSLENYRRWRESFYSRLSRFLNTIPLVQWHYFWKTSRNHQLEAENIQFCFEFLCGAIKHRSSLFLYISSPHVKQW